MPKPWVPDNRDALRAGDTVILAVEDDPVFARTLVDMIRRKGYRALAAGDGESGLYLARQYRPTGILLDVMLPGIDGWDVLTRLKQEPATRRIPVHFISATDDTARAQQLGAVGFLTKPAERDALLGAFERLLQSSLGPTRKVLLIDGDPDSRVAVASLIKSDTVEIVEVGSAEEGAAADRIERVRRRRARSQPTRHERLRLPRPAAFSPRRTAADRDPLQPRTRPR